MSKEITLEEYLYWLCEQRDKEIREKERARREDRKAGELLRKESKDKSTR